MDSAISASSIEAWAVKWKFNNFQNSNKYFLFSVSWYLLWLRAINWKINSKFKLLVTRKPFSKHCNFKFCHIISSKKSIARSPDIYKLLGNTALCLCNCVPPLSKSLSRSSDYWNALPEFLSRILIWSYPPRPPNKELSPPIPPLLHTCLLHSTPVYSPPTCLLTTTDAISVSSTWDNWSSSWTAAW